MVAREEFACADLFFLDGIAKFAVLVNRHMYTLKILLRYDERPE